MSHPDPLAIQRAISSVRDAFRILGFQHIYHEILVLEHDRKSCTPITVAVTTPYAATVTVSVAAASDAPNASVAAPSVHSENMSRQSSQSSIFDSESTDKDEVKELEETEEVKEVIIAAPKKKYKERTLLEDSQRCIHILSTGDRCTLRRFESSDLCSRHSKKAVNESQ